MTGLSFRKVAYHMLAVITLLMVIADVLVLLFSKATGEADRDMYTDLSHSWYVSGNAGLSSEPISGQIPLHSDSTFFVYIDIPDDASIKSRSCISFMSYSCAFDLLVEDRIIYSYGKDRLREGKMIPSKVHYVSIPEDAVRKNVKIVFIAGKEGASVNPESSYFGDIEKLSRIFIRKRAYAFFLCAFLVTYGFLLISLCAFNNRHRNITLSTISQGLLLIDLGIYISCYNNTFYYITRDDVASTFVEYLSLYAIPFLVQTAILTNRKKYAHPVHIAVAVIDAGVVIFAALLHYLGVTQVIAMAPAIRTFMALHGIYTFLFIRYIIVNEKKNMRTFLFADAAVTTVDFGLMSLLSLLLVNFILWKQGILHLEFLNSDVKGNFIILGALIYAGCVTLGYFFHSLAVTHEQEISEALHEAAYTDELTGIKNRAFFDHIVGLWQSEDVHGSVITLDLDGLKKINDNIGHEAGDKYIASFASILDTVTPDGCAVCRTGGDEFVILLRYHDSAACNMIMDKISRTVDDYNKENASMPINYSVGAASCEDFTENNVYEILRLSDKRMYEMKDEHHRQGKGGRS